MPDASGLTPFATMKGQSYSLGVRDAEKAIIPALRDHKMCLLPYSPLANGLLSGKYRGDSQFRRARAWGGCP